MKAVLFALNGSYSHTNLAIRCLRAPLAARGFDVALVEGTLGDTDSRLLDLLFAERADVYGFSCYIWNIDAMLRLASDIKKLLPNAAVVLGGPEVMFDTERFSALSFVDHIVCGEGERVFCSLCEAIKNGEKPERVIRSNDMSLTDGILYSPEEPHRRLMYYESSRGCPYNCAYCLSSATRGVAAKDARQTLAELYEFEKFDDDITVKLVDRTFNFDKKRANEIWRGLLDEKYTKKYHFEICASLLDDESFEIFEKFPKGKIRLEVGLQSTKKETLAATSRHIEPKAVLDACKKIKDMGNIHVHLDLICGLPGDGFFDVASAFDEAFGCSSLVQVGFLKLLHGTALRRDAEKLGIKYRDHAPYEVLATRDISYEELRKLHEISDVMERFFDSGKFEGTLEYALSLSDSPFAFFSGLCDFIESEDGRPIRRIGQNDACRLLYSYVKNEFCADEDRLEALIHDDFSKNEVRRAPRLKGNG